MAVLEVEDCFMSEVPLYRIPLCSRIMDWWGEEEMINSVHPLFCFHTSPLTLSFPSLLAPLFPLLSPSSPLDAA